MPARPPRRRRRSKPRRRAGTPRSMTSRFQVPIFVLTHHPPRTPLRQDERLTFACVGDGVAAVVSRAMAAAGDKAVQVVGGARVIQQLLQAGLVDELHVDVMPVLLGGGLWCLEN